MAQLLLFPDPRPLVERLGVEFFRCLPDRPGVYLMRDAQDAVLYVGKAKNLRQRLGHYRVANPDRMPRRHLRLLRAVDRIEWRECPDEASALAREAALLRELKPRFNRAGTWPSSPWYLAWRCAAGRLEMTVTEIVPPGWQALGPANRHRLRTQRTVLARLLWGAVHPQRGGAELPPGWEHGSFHDRTVIPLSPGAKPLVAAFEQMLLHGTAGDLFNLLSSGGAVLSHFEQNSRQANLETLAECLGLPGVGATRNPSLLVNNDISLE